MKSFKSESRILEGIVPSEFRRTFGLMAEAGDQPKFNFATSPKKGAPGVGPARDEDGMDAAPPADEPARDKTPDPGEGKGADKAKWLVKKLVGTLKYAGAMATEIRGSMPEEAVEVIDKLVSDLEEMRSALQPYAGEEQAPEPEAEGELTEPGAEGGGDERQKR